MRPESGQGYVIRLNARLFLTPSGRLSEQLAKAQVFETKREAQNVADTYEKETRLEYYVRPVSLKVRGL